MHAGRDSELRRSLQTLDYESIAYGLAPLVGPMVAVAGSANACLARLARLAHVRTYTLHCACRCPLPAQKKVPARIWRKTHSCFFGMYVVVLSSRLSAFRMSQNFPSFYFQNTDGACRAVESVGSFGLGRFQASRPFAGLHGFKWLRRRCLGPAPSAALW